MSRNLRFNILINKYNMVVYSLSVVVFQATQVELGQSILEINVDQPFKSEKDSYSKISMSLIVFVLSDQH